MKLSQYPADSVLCSFIEKLTIPIDSNLYHAITVMEMSKEYGLPAGLAIVVDLQSRLAGVITDGDIRRALIGGYSSNSPVTNVMRKTPIVIFEDTSPDEVLENIRRQMQKQGTRRVIKHAILINKDRHVLGIIDVDKLALSRSWQWDTIGVIGLGYVGLTLAVSLAEIGFQVIGWDINEQVRSQLREGIPHIYEVGLESLLKAQLEKKGLSIASSYKELKKCRVFIICVNIPVSDKTPHVSQLENAIYNLTEVLKPGDLLVIRSTVPVGTCRNLVINTVETQTKYEVGRDIGLAFAPERTVEGKAMEELRTLPQIIGGFNRWSTESAAGIFSKLSPTIVRVDTLEQAEFIKLVNNTFRDISFAFANEVAMICEAYNLDVVKIIKACNSGYPRNPISLPSPGVGGLCLTKDPYIFASAAKRNNKYSLAEVGRKINEQIPLNIARRVIHAIHQQGKQPSECTAFVLGFGYKGEPEITDMRSSPTIDLITALRYEIGEIYGYDPVVPAADIEKIGVPWKDVEKGFLHADVVLLMNNHRSFASLDIYSLVKTMNHPAILFDGWCFYDAKEIEQIPGVYYMGLSYFTPWQQNSKMY